VILELCSFESFRVEVVVVYWRTDIYLDLVWYGRDLVQMEPVQCMWWLVC